ncbi:MAG: hypothetical protein JWM64_2456 [Frankiales bacterium]|nr:hypothetical protein [Frankiales bacterium]
MIIGVFCTQCGREQQDAICVVCVDELKRSEASARA